MRVSRALLCSAIALALALAMRGGQPVAPAGLPPAGLSDPGPIERLVPPALQDALSERSLEEPEYRRA